MSRFFLVLVLILVLPVAFAQAADPSPSDPAPPDPGYVAPLPKPAAKPPAKPVVRQAKTTVKPAALPATDVQTLLSVIEVCNDELQSLECHERALNGQRKTNAALEEDWALCLARCRALQAARAKAVAQLRKSVPNAQRFIAAAELEAVSSWGKPKKTEAVPASAVTTTH